MFISSVVLRAVLAELENRHHRVDRVVRASQLERGALLSPSVGIRCREFARVVQAAVEVSGDAALGLRVGAHAPETMLHVVGLMLVTSRTIRDAVNVLSRYGALVISGVEFKLVEEGELATFTFASDELEESEPAVRRFLVECLLALALRIGARFAPTEGPHEVRVRHAEPNYGDLYRDAFRCPVRFSSASDAVVFPRSVVDRPQTHADATTHAALAALADGLQRETKGMGSFANRVRVALRYQSDLSKVDMEQLADSWGLSRRALRRRLANEGMSITELLDEARCARAVAELRRPECKIKQVAEELGYSETSAFYRAFKRWTGSTPADYRMNMFSRLLAPALASAE